MVSLKLPDHALTRALRDWKSLLRIARPVQHVAILDRRHIYILPTRQGLLFAAVLTCMLIGSINYALSLGFVLTFLLAGLGVVGMFHTWRNLVGLSISGGRTQPVFAGETAHFGFRLSGSDALPRYAIALQGKAATALYADVPAHGTTEIVLPMSTSQRGWLSPGRLTVFTEFPLGLFHAWSYVESDTRCLVYPRPAPPGLPLPAADAGNRASHHLAPSGDEDFAGLRSYQYGDSLRRVDWKASAREQGLFTKQFQGTGSAALWLAWEMAPGEPETRISQLTRWVMDAHAAGLGYGLRLPGKDIPPASGTLQLQRCLEALALLGTSA